MFCYYPWTFVQILPSGKLNACCFSSVGQIVDQHNKALKIQNYPDVESIINSATNKKLRSSLLKDQFPEDCKTCQNIELSSRLSPRNAINTGLSKYIDEATLITNTDTNGYLKDAKIQYLELRLGNSCNLRCRICGPHNSSSWVSDFSKMKSSNLSFDIQKVYPSHENRPSWPDSELFLNWLAQIAPTLINLQFAGGEPLLAPLHKDVLEMLIVKGLAKNINLIYTTNGTISPEPFFEYWKQFKSVIVFVSIDGVRSTFEYQRWPAKWTDVEKIFESFSSQIGKGVTKLFIQPTISIYNIANIYDLIVWYLERKTEVQWVRHVHFLTDPYYLSPFVLSRIEKESVLAKLKGDHKKLLGQFGSTLEVQQIQQWTDSLCDLLCSEDWSDKRTDFTSFNGSLDNTRQISFKNYLDPLTVSFFS